MTLDTILELEEANKMDSIALAWRGTVSEDSVKQAVEKLGLNTACLSRDLEVNPGFQECEQTLSLDGIIYLVESSKDSTSNELTLRLADEIDEGRKPCLSQLAHSLLRQEREADFWFLFAHDWPEGIEVAYFEGAPDDFESYLRINRGAYRILRSFSKGVYNIDLDTPTVWKLTN